MNKFYHEFKLVVFLFCTGLSIFVYAAPAGHEVGGLDRDPVTAPYELHEPISERPGERGVTLDDRDSLNPLVSKGTGNSGSHEGTVSPVISVDPVSSVSTITSDGDSAGSGVKQSAVEVQNALDALDSAQGDLTNTTNDSSGTQTTADTVVDEKKDQAAAKEVVDHYYARIAKLQNELNEINVSSLTRDQKEAYLDQIDALNTVIEFTTEHVQSLNSDGSMDTQLSQLTKSDVTLDTLQQKLKPSKSALKKQPIQSSLSGPKGKPKGSKKPKITFSSETNFKVKHALVESSDKPVVAEPDKPVVGVASEQEDVSKEPEQVATPEQIAAVSKEIKEFIALNESAIDSLDSISKAGLSKIGTEERQKNIKTCDALIQELEDVISVLPENQRPKGLMNRLVGYKEAFTSDKVDPSVAKEAKAAKIKAANQALGIKGK